MNELLVVFVHGYSVTTLETYGELPLRLREEAAARKLILRVEDIFLGRYISFNDQVTLADISKALNRAISLQMPAGKRFICISHSTGGPVMRTWWKDYYQSGSECPMSHLIMLAPANHGSALAQLGKSRLSRVRSWFDGVEPGQGVLNWLELGSDESWKLNEDWILNGEKHISPSGTFPFVITGQDIDRRLYDHINSYTGELGSDGAVRVASANLNSAYVKLDQVQVKQGGSSLEINMKKVATTTALRILRRRSHSGDKMGIMRSVKRQMSDAENQELIDSIFLCISVNTLKEYHELCEEFRIESAQVQSESRIELEIKPVRQKLYIHDRYSMIMFRVQDMEGRLVPDFDLILTADNDDPDLLPTGFFADRQINRANLSTVTYYINFDVMNGTAEVIDPKGELVRKHIQGVEKLGLIVRARPSEGFVKYQQCILKASTEFLRLVVRPNSTTLVDIYLQRMVNEEIFRFEKTDGRQITGHFKDVKPGTYYIS